MGGYHSEAPNGYYIVRTFCTNCLSLVIDNKIPKTREVKETLCDKCLCRCLIPSPKTF